MEEKIKRELTDHMVVANALLNRHIDDIHKLAKLLIDAYNRGGRLIIFGNGGSAADAQHIAAELVNYQYMTGRPMLDSVALTVNTSIITAIGNDIGFENLFSRQIENLVNDKDVIVAISTSGNSPNILKGVIAAKAKGAKVVGLTNKNGGKMNNMKEIDHLVKIPSLDTARVQEGHITVLHVACSLVEKELFQEKRFT
ncbi:MAG: SIS domain-containing protein [Nanoarchaeota archaeon]|nr:SIS domain-containing protein [Nanoarchaeota archaeon]